jgi:predicted alpha-1,6-mannanase (GH76 family)
MLELAEDAYQRSGKAIYRNMVTQLYAGFVWMHGTAWTRDPYNDDVMWMVLAALRMQTITGKTAYRDQARRQFDAVYARAKTNDFGGGLWWSTGRTAKNACINAPAAIAAAELYSSLHNSAYLVKARSLYGWVRAHLFDQTTGAVYDRISWQTTATGKVAVVDRATYTYNQGSFIGAADLLFRLTGDVTYYRDAVKALDYAQDNLTNQGILRSEGAGGDGGGFKGIFARWAVKFTRDRGIKRYEPWFQQNARAALAARSAANLMDQDWSRPTGAGRLYSFDTSSAVALLQALAPGRANRSFVP